MRFKKLVLNNIRSYVNETIVFPEGTILLSGDVGSGKTTLLLAIEFALFGLLRGEISASSLLRHGSSEGFVELEFVINNSTFIVKRTLKRDKNSIKQSSGSLTINNVSELLTPVELKSRLLSILGYPESLLSKSKNLIFRYTVYTPQEDMKKIILESSDLRLGILRKLFGIDSYKTALENSSLLIRDFSLESKMINNLITDFKREEDELKNLVSELNNTVNEISSINELLVKEEKNLLAKESLLKSLIERTKIFDEKKREFDVINIKLVNANNRIKSVDEELALNNKKLLEIKPLVFDSKDLVLLNEKLEKALNNKDAVNKKLSIANSRKAALETKIRILEDEVSAINSLQSTCPRCHQPITPDHKEKLLAENEAELSSLRNKLSKTIDFIEKASLKESEIDSLISSLRSRINELSVLQARVKEQEKQKKFLVERISSLKAEKESLEKDVKELKLVLDGLSKELGAANDLRLEKESLEKEIIGLKELINNYKIRLSALNEKKSHEESRINSLREKGSFVSQQKKKHDSLLRMIDWLKETFQPAVAEIERLVLATLHQEFSILFSEWFSKIIRDDSIRVSLNDEFTPVVEQNGYETDVVSLSGGEKTALALAYRLALYHIINEFIGSINARGVIILDEPTDGFSEFQLDNLKEVLKEINIEQLIIVSHESKMESFSENIIRIHKQEQESRAEYL